MANVTNHQPTSKITSDHLQKVGIIIKSNSNARKSDLKKIVAMLKKFKKEVFLDVNSAPVLGVKNGHSKTELLQVCDLVLTLGGDGTLLKAAGCTAKKPTLILGVNFGNLGFLTESMPEKLEQDLKKLFEGHYYIDERFLLRINHYRNGQRINTFLALNDAVINQGAFARLIEMQVEINKQRMVTFKADGLIVSSPTGSTGHALSAGGPIVHPSLPAFILTPICPATLSVRPIVIPNDREIKITLTTQRKENQNVGLTLDGQKTIPLQYGDEIKIRQSKRKFLLIRLKGGSSYYRMLRSKLHWGEHHGD